ncbi:MULTISPECIES: cell division protein ZipA C-terminal FtsZ-binding domain-containing protein [Pandoraea]|uniref:cell division protein ZipA C-terminal FtsZ-binding domain-containing protein n=1 Tax=Pandoraea TaxID=93217 RepID=UPI001F5E032B|nr:MULTISPECIES: cell division protein ZipA C-terminal FtsZ-binding domain-containing protein [Pandoraea]MCI3208465.1 cell division protein FtsZ [Pandoraea sp. LA3]MDN4586494.1 cell division protein FtsZ [Pandoraea capi]
MNELQLSLIAAGVVVLLGVVAYNAWQGSKARARIPRRMPVDGAGIDATAGAPDADDDRPFIEPTLSPPRVPAQSGERREPTLGPATATTSVQDAFAINEDAWDAPPAARKRAAQEAAARAAAEAGGAGESVATAEVADAESDARQEDDAVARDAQEADAVSAVARVDAELAADDTVDAATAGAAAAAAGASDGVPAAVTIAPLAAADAVPSTQGAAAVRPATPSGPPPIIDERIDCIVELPLANMVAAERLMPLTVRMRRAGSKPVNVEGRLDEASSWEPIRTGGRYHQLRMAVQLANRAGALNEVEFSEFSNLVQTLADAVDALPELPDMMETVARGRELDAFAAQCDAQLSVNVLSDGAPWSANYVQAVATQDGLLLSRDGMRFVKLDARQNPVFMLQFGDTNFLRDDLTYKGGDLITMLLDVPVADEDLLPFRLMCDYARSIGQRIGGRVVDDQRRPLSDAALQNVDKQLLKLYERLEARGLPAGSPVTRRLFSQ